MHQSLRSCECGDCAHGRLVARLSDRIAQMAVRQIDLENALRNCVADLRGVPHGAESLALAKKVLGDE